MILTGQAFDAKVNPLPSGHEAVEWTWNGSRFRVTSAAPGIILKLSRHGTWLYHAEFSAGESVEER